MLKRKIKGLITYSILLFIIPMTLVLGVILFRGKQYALISILVALLSIIPPVLCFEKGKQNTIRLVLIAVMIAISVSGRFIFGIVPFFKPVTAITIITAIYFGSEAGFITGAMTALISNFYFGQGPWTPFQMFAWGMLGFFAGVFARTLIKNRLFLLGYGVLAGVVYSLILDVFSALWQDNTFLLSRYVAMLISSLPMTAIYVISNVIFLLILANPIGEKIMRIKTKYGS